MKTKHRSGEDRRDCTEFQRLYADAECGHPDAQYKLALAYFHGAGAPISTAKTLFWLRKAAQPSADTRTQEKAKNILRLFAIINH
jgi:TPR repeat protein